MTRHMHMLGINEDQASRDCLEDKETQEHVHLGIKTPKDPNSNNAHDLSEEAHPMS